MAPNMRKQRLRTSRYWLAVCAASLTAACAIKSDQADEKATPHQPSVNVSTIVLAPVSMPDGFEEYTAAMAEFDSLIARELKAAGYQTVPAEEYALLWEGILERTDGLFDSLTGERNEAAFDTAREMLFALLSEQYHPDALLYPEVWLVDAPFSGGTAQWDGAAEELVGVGTRIVDALGALFSPNESNLPTGEVEAASLVVFVESMTGEELFANSGGIQVLEKVGSNPEDRRRVPKEKIFTNRSRNRRAVRIALGPIL